MGIGQRKQIKLQQITVARTDSGRNIEGEGDSFTTWAEITNPSGGRDYLNGQTQLSSTKRFLVRFRFDKYPNVEWKLEYDKKYWTISDIQKVNEKNFYWQFTATSKNDV